MDAVEETGKPGDEAANPAGHSDPEARTPLGGIILTVRVVVVVKTPADSSDDGTNEGKREQNPSAASGVGEILEAVMNAGKAVDKEQEGHASVYDETSLSDSASLSVEWEGRTEEDKNMARGEAKSSGR